MTGVFPRCGLHRWRAHAQEWIRCLFLPQRCRHGGFPGVAQCCTGRGPVPDLHVVGLHGQGEAQVGLGIFVRAIDECVVGQRADPIQGIQHLCRRAFEQASATGHEQRVSCKQDAGAMIGNVPARVSRYCQHAESRLQSLYKDSVAIPQRYAAPGDVLGRGSVNGDRVTPQQFLDAAHVVAMVMRGQDGAGFQPVGRERREHGRRVAGVDDGRVPAVGCHDQPDVIVGECRDWFNLHHAPMLASTLSRVNTSCTPRRGRRVLTVPTDGLALEQWFEGTVGAYVLALERRHVQRFLPDMFGYHLVQVGMPGKADFGESSRIHHRVMLGTEAGAYVGAVLTEADRLPLASDSIDVIILPHVLEFAANPHRVLREAERALIGEGHLLVLAFNPWSLWGIWRLLLGWRRRAPWNGRFYTVARVRDWLSLLDFDIVGVERFAFCPPLRRAAGRMDWLEYLGAALWPRLGADAMIVARKRVLPLTPVRHRWQARRTLIAAGLAEPSTRGRCE